MTTAHLIQIDWQQLRELASSPVDAIRTGAIAAACRAVESQLLSLSVDEQIRKSSDAPKRHYGAGAMVHYFLVTMRPTLLDEWRRRDILWAVDIRDAVHPGHPMPNATKAERAVRYFERFSGLLESIGAVSVRVPQAREGVRHAGSSESSSVRSGGATCETTTSSILDAVIDPQPTEMETGAAQTAPSPVSTPFSATPDVLPSEVTEETSIETTSTHSAAPAPRLDVEIDSVEHLAGAGAGAREMPSEAATVSTLRLFASTDEEIPLTQPESARDSGPRSSGTEGNVDGSESPESTETSAPTAPVPISRDTAASTATLVVVPHEFTEERSLKTVGTQYAAQAVQPLGVEHVDHAERATRQTPSEAPVHGHSPKRIPIMGLVLCGMGVFIAAIAAAFWITSKYDTDNTAPIAVKHSSASHRDRHAVPATRGPDVRTASQAKTAPGPTPIVPTPPVFTGPPGSLVCQAARSFAPNACTNVPPNRVSGLQADWSQPVYVCANGEARGQNLCNCRVCKRIPN